MNIWQKIRLSKPRRPLCFLIAGTLVSTFAIPASAVSFSAMPKLFVSALTTNAPESSNPIKLALNESTGQHLTTYIAGEILERMGYNVEYVTAGYIPQFIALQEGTVTATLEIRESSIGDTSTSAVASGNVEDLGSVGLTPIEGWYYPDYVAEACPGLPDYKALNKCAVKFATADTTPKGRLIDYPAEWESKNDKRVKALDLDFDVITAESEDALIAKLKLAALTKQPFVMMFWGPHWAHNVYPGDWIEFPEHKPACTENPKWGSNSKEVYDCGFANTWINKFVWAGTKDKWPGAYKLLQAFLLENTQQETMLKAVHVDGGEEKSVAKAWVNKNTHVWKPWVEAAM